MGSPFPTSCSFPAATLILLGVAVVLPTLPARAEDWSAWKHRLSIRLIGGDRETSGLLPVDVDFSIKAAEIGDPVKELRLVYEAAGMMREVPFQLSRLTRWTRDLAEGKSVATLDGRITFFDVSGGDAGGRYILLYGNPASQAPQYDTDLRVSGQSPGWTIENAKIRVELSGGSAPEEPKAAAPAMPQHDIGKSGQLAAVTVKSRPQFPITNQRRLLHWNPDIFIPARGWMHAYAWNPRESVEIERGPVFVEVRRRGPFPSIPEVDLAVTYRVFAGRNFIESATRMDLREDLGVVALRNDELTFNQNLFTHVAFESGATIAKKRMSDYPAVNKHGDFLRLEPDAPFVAFYSPEKKLGAATVRLEESNAGPDGGPPVLFDHATYLAHGEELHYWFRSLVYFSVGWDRTQLMRVAKGSSYAERNLYLFYDIETDGEVEGVARLVHAARHPPDLRLGDIPYPPDK